MNKGIKVAFVGTEFTAKMSGYAGMALPQAMAQFGVEVHVIAGNRNVYSNHPRYDEMYGGFLGPAITECGTEQVGGVVLHRLPHQRILGRIRLRGLFQTLARIQPNVVHYWMTGDLLGLEIALFKLLLRYRLYTAQHTCASVYPLAAKKSLELTDILKTAPVFALGRVVSWFSTRCYPATIDCRGVGVRFFGVQPKKCLVRHLGVNTDLFKPITDAILRKDREELRTELGFRPDDIVCLYTGRFQEDKNPLCLAMAIDKLRGVDARFRGLFIGEGHQRAAIERCSGCTVHPFMNYYELPPFYRAADIGIWPTQESTSMLDAAASGLPIVVSNKLMARERVDGNGDTYDEGNVGDLARALLSLRDIETRMTLGRAGAKKMAEQFSWEAIARRTLLDFEGQF